ncbi:MAG: alpha/beta fold hydrolase [Myxococcaceae bacterium]
MRVLYFHGGPGFSSNPEKQLLADPFARAGFTLKLWNEPSKERPAGPPFRSERAFENYLDHAERFLLENCAGERVVLLGHSFGAHPVRYLAARHPEKLAKVIYVCPDLSVSDGDKNIFAIGIRDFAKHGDDRHKQVQEVLAQYTGAFDGNTLKGFQLVAQNPRLFDYYWHDRERMAEFFRHNQGPEHGLNIEAFVAVRSSLSEAGGQDSPVPAAVVFGAHDIVVSKAAELAILRRGHRKLTVHDFEGSAHYPHVEETGRFLRMLADEVRATA